MLNFNECICGLFQILGTVPNPHYEILGTPLCLCLYCVNAYRASAVRNALLVTIMFYHMLRPFQNFMSLKPGELGKLIAGCYLSLFLLTACATACTLHEQCGIVGS